MRIASTLLCGFVRDSVFLGNDSDCIGVLACSGSHASSGGLTVADRIGISDALIIRLMILCSRHHEMSLSVA
jgi:hypothetical protein